MTSSGMIHISHNVATLEKDGVQVLILATTCGRYYFNHNGDYYILNTERDAIDQALKVAFL